MTPYLFIFFLAGVVAVPASSWAQAGPPQTLAEAASRGDLAGAQALIKAGADPNATDSYGYTPAMWAIRRGNPSMLQLLLSASARLPAPTPSFVPMAVAARSGSAALVSLLAAKGADPNAKAALGKTPMIFAAASGSTATVQALIAARADINAADNRGQTPLIAAAQLGEAAMAGYLVDHGAAVNAADSFGYTALMWAAQDGSLATVQALLARGANAGLKSKAGRAAAEIARERGYSAIARALQ